jgi:hypothetical protein
MVYDTNAYLTQDQMTVNAQYILDFFTGQGWTKNAVCGMLGNMQSESGINFGIYESLDSSSSTNGFGLVQWTPNTKYFNWASSNGYGSDHVNGELQRILWEVANNEQWISTSTYPMTFQEFTQSTDTAYNLAMVFIKNYERPANPNQPIRGTQADYWYTNLTGGGGGIIPPPPPPNDDNANIVSMLLSDTLNGWKW